MKCSECGAELTGADKFCSNCGAAVPRGDTASPDEATASATETSESALPEPEPILADDTQLEAPEPSEVDAEPAFEPLLPLEETPLDFEPTEAAGTAPSVVKATGKRNTGLIIAIVVLVILLLCCCCIVGVIGLNWEEIMMAIESQI